MGVENQTMNPITIPFTQLKTLLLIPLVVICGSAFSQEKLPHTIAVTGSSELTVHADRATFQFTVLGLGASLREAVGNAKSKASEIVEALLKMGVPQSSLHTQDFFTGENSDKAFLSSSRDFKARITTIVSLDSLVLLQGAVLLVSEKQPETISNVNFALRDPLYWKTEAEHAAVMDAKSRAARIAQELGVTIKSPLTVESTIQYPVPYRSMQVQAVEIVGGSNSGSAPFITSRDIIIYGSVRVVFEF